MIINNHGYSWGGLEPPSKGLCNDKFLLSWSFRLRRCSQLPHETQNTGELQVISEYWSWIIYIPQKGSTSSPKLLHWRMPATSSNHWRHHLNILSPSLHIMNCSTFTLQPNTTKNYFSHTLNSTSGISPKSELSWKHFLWDFNYINLVGLSLKYNLAYLPIVNFSWVLI